MNINKSDFDVSIVGCGPAGKMLAIELAQRGWKVGIFEQWPSPYSLPRAVVLDNEIKRALYAICDKKSLRKIMQSVPANDTYEWRNASGQTLLSLDDWAEASFFSQPELEKLLLHICASYPNIQVSMGHEAVQLTEHSAYVELTVKSEDSPEKTITSQYLVGCDGANSFVRSHMDIEVTDLGFSYDWLIVDVIPHEEREWKPMNWQLCDPERPTTIVSGGPGRRRWEFMRRPEETIDYLNNADTAWRLLEPWGITPENATLERHAVYNFRARWAESWREGRLLLAGDSAHLMPPFYGQGMNSGLRDAKNLGWKLDLVLGGIAEEKLLDTYTMERKPHATNIIDSSIYLGELICIDNPVATAARDEAFLTGNAPPFLEFPILTDGILHRELEGYLSTLAGKLSPHAQVSYQGKQGFLDDVIGRGWKIISTKDDPRTILSEEQMTILNDLETQFVHITLDQLSTKAAIDIDGEYTKYFKENGIETLIIRPDFYIFGGITFYQELPSVIDELSKQIQITISSTSVTA
ncbi:bifunctional 3-(3-hydroxy-phenyl)propionate/3-hydroxycinnamic acid hydroxylase MhpA [Sporosarcina ureae]|uniref:bifunctional 3-(3-hydroxy-phenyl)propionate/3-hydroxycinnamic acid hydroxylase MhpA n=1 Tax=Sporosarcina ureae TaxID=1571 RepID=UPI0028B1DF22|nr:bifunctional 3-(3-hydroxy-phenyl)propionate/3-hydroxycinnamic acid hydroxylase [Sporosarcina ureae]